MSISNAVSLLPAKRLLRLHQVLERYPVSKSYWYSGIKKGIHPKPIKCGKVSFWDESDLNELIENQKNG